ncbi:GntR family transcriptional regulator [Bacillus rubiinfantis]|uniref:GntR family transcriptional regulator n=1 Tax=Bacillus rubiinfantis TaxID=1499680 RepID=UPI0005A8262E|nr:GntR family transcriptional regulator [Bacillus rubiinfantis]
MKSFSIEKPVRYYDQVYHSIRKRIVDGELQPGDSLYEARIARELNISRSPVREAIRALEKEGLLEIDEKSRITVYKPTLKDIEDIYECRMALESLGAKLTARFATSKEIEELETTLLKSKEFLEVDTDPNKVALIEENSRFHDLIIEFSQNNRLKKILTDLHSLIIFYRTLNFHDENREWVVYYEHQAIFDQIKRKDEEKAAFLMKKHLETDLQHLRKIFSTGL